MYEEDGIQYTRKRSLIAIELSRISLVVMDLIIAALSLVTVIAFGYVLKFFKWECPLYSKLELEFISTSLSNETVVINEFKWGQTGLCWFPLSISVLCTMGNFIWAWLLMHFKMRIYQEGIYHSYVFMSVIFEVTMFLFALASSLIITKGQKVWCNNMTKETSYTCRQILNFPWKIVETQRDIYLYIQAAKISSWMTAVSLLLVTLFASIRFYGSCCCSIRPCGGRDKGEHYMSSSDAGKNGPTYSALRSVNTEIGFENSFHSINDNRLISTSSSDD